MDRLVQMAVSQLPPGTMGMNGVPGMDGGDDVMLCYDVLCCVVTIAVSVGSLRGLGR